MQLLPTVLKYLFIVLRHLVFLWKESEKCVEGHKIAHMQSFKFFGSTHLCGLYTSTYVHMYIDKWLYLLEFITTSEHITHVCIKLTHSFNPFFYTCVSITLPHMHKHTRDCRLVAMKLWRWSGFGSCLRSWMNKFFDLNFQLLMPLIVFCFAFNWLRKKISNKKLLNVR